VSFEQWLKRPVYVVQCRTWKLAAELNLCGQGLLRVRPACRDERANAARKALANAVKQQRASRRTHAVA
jgi:hypothetical protein